MGPSRRSDYVGIYSPSTRFAIKETGYLLWSKQPKQDINTRVTRLVMHPTGCQVVNVSSSIGNEMKSIAKLPKRRGTVS